MITELTNYDEKTQKFLPPYSEFSGGDGRTDGKVQLKCLEILSQTQYPTLTKIAETLKVKFKKQLGENTISEVTDLIKTLLFNAPEYRNLFYSEGKLILDSDTLTALATATIHEDQRSIGWVKNPRTRRHNLEKLIRYSGVELVALQQRPITKLCRETVTNIPVTYTQQCGYIDHKHRFVANLSIGCGINHHRLTTSRDHNINSAKISIDHGGEVKHLLVRSGRSDNITQMLKLLQFNFLAAWESSNNPGITFVGRKIYFRLALISGQDPSPGKAILKKFQQKVVKSEPQSLKDIKKSVEFLWKSGKPLELEVQDSKGETITFYAEKPILINSVLSYTANDVSVITMARRWSIEGGYQLLELLLQSPMIQNNSKLTGPLTRLSQKVKEYLNAKYIPDKVFDEIKTVTLNESETIETKLQRGLEAIKIILTNYNLKGEIFIAPYTPGIVALYLYELFDLLNISVTVQCKAGCDRALMLTALFLAKRHVDMESAKVTRIDLMKCLSDEKRHFAEEFKTFAGDFGYPIIKANRGNNRMKAVDKPFIQFLFDTTSVDVLEHIIPKLVLKSGT